MSRKEKETTGKKFLYFPNRLNSLALLLITVIYTVILGAIFYFSFSNVTYKDKISYEHNMFENEINSMVTVTTATIPNDDASVSMTNNVFLSSSSLKPTQLNNVSYAVYGKSSDGTLYYLYQTANSKRTQTPVSHQITSGKSIHGTFTSFFVKTWHNTELPDSSAERTVVETEEDVITLNYEDLNKYAWGTDNTIKIDDLTAATINLTLTDHTKGKANDYIKSLSLNIGYGTGATTKRHIDTQSYLLTDDDKLYPLIGVYGIEKVASVTAPLSAKIYDIDATAIYTITKYYTEDGKLLTNYLVTELN